MTNQRIFQLFIAALLMASIASEAEVRAFAQENQPENWLLAKYDFNDDSAISADEISYKRERLFNRMDADADGAVSLDEYQSRDARRRAVLLRARFLKLDLDDDQRLSAREYSSYLGSFDRFDSDNNGHVTQAEMAQSPEDSNASHALMEEEHETHCLLWLCVRTSF